MTNDEVNQTTKNEKSRLLFRNSLSLIASWRMNSLFSDSTPQSLRRLYENPIKESKWSLFLPVSLDEASFDHGTKKES